MSLLYSELRAIAGRALRSERRDHTLQATALVHEAYLRLAEPLKGQVRDDVHFKVLASQAIRRVLIDHARARHRLKRGGDRLKLTWIEGFDHDQSQPQDHALDLLALDEALRSLAAIDERKSRVVELRFFGGLDINDIASTLGVTDRTIRKDWATARAWLFQQLKGEMPA